MITFEYHEDISGKIIDELWDQKVDMDDWDYLLFVDEEYAEHFEPNEREDYYRGTHEPRSSCQHFEKLLQGCCTNAWYKVENFNGKKGFLGIAYHA